MLNMKINKMNEVIIRRDGELWAYLAYDPVERCIEYATLTQTHFIPLEDNPELEDLFDERGAWRLKEVSKLVDVQRVNLFRRVIGWFMRI